MELKKYLKDNKLKISEISRTSGLPYTTVNDLINGRTSIRKTSVDTALRLADALGISIDSLIMLSSPPRIEAGKWTGKIKSSGKKYYLDFTDGDVSGEKYLCKANKTNSEFITTIATWKLEEIARKERIGSWNTMN